MYLWHYMLLWLEFCPKVFPNTFLRSFFLKFAGFLCVIRLDSYANELPFQSTKEFDACEKFAFFPILMFKVPIPSGNRLSGQLQNKISTFPGKLCCFVTSAKKKLTHKHFLNDFWFQLNVCFLMISYWIEQPRMLIQWQKCKPEMKFNWNQAILAGSEIKNKSNYKQFKCKISWFLLLTETDKIVKFGWKNWCG